MSCSSVPDKSHSLHQIYMLLSAGMDERTLGRKEYDSGDRCVHYSVSHEPFLSNKWNRLEACLSAACSLCPRRPYVVTVNTSQYVRLKSARAQLTSPEGGHLNLASAEVVEVKYFNFIIMSKHVLWSLYRNDADVVWLIGIWKATFF